jgi:hypothetical protein
VGTTPFFFPDDIPLSTGNYSTFERQFQGQFNTISAVNTGTSVLRRPDAVSLDYLVAFTLGPVAVGDVSQGPIAFIWRVRVDNSINTVYVTRAQGNTWGPESVLFTFSGEPIIELDTAFDQSGRVLVCAERATGGGNTSEIWIYWFNPFTSLFEFDDFEAGRTPRALLDNPSDLANSDIQVFFMSDSGSVGIVYRQQRDAYAIVHTTPVTTAINIFLEDVVKVEDTRLRVIYSIHDPSTGTYTFGALETTLFPYHTDVDGLTHAFLALLATLVISEYTTFDIDGMTNAYLLISGTLIVSGISYTTFDIDGLIHAYVPISGTLMVATVTYMTFDVDGLTNSYIPISGTLIVTVITYTTFDIDGLTHAYVPISGTLT